MYDAKLMRTIRCTTPACRRAQAMTFFIRFWLDREIRECEQCHARYSHPLPEEGVR